MAIKKNIDTTNWQVFDEEFDLIVAPGLFISNERSVYKFDGEDIEALNYYHAYYLWLWRKLDSQGESRHNCHHCGARIRYATIYKDGDKVHIAGRDCAQYIECVGHGGMDEAAYRIIQETRRVLDNAKAKTTSRGDRVIYSMEAPSSFWNIPKDQRPSWASMSKYKNTWYLTIWAGDRDELMHLYWELKVILEKAATLPRPPKR